MAEPDWKAMALSYAEQVQECRDTLSMVVGLADFQRNHPDFAAGIRQLLGHSELVGRPECHVFGCTRPKGHEGAHYYVRHEEEEEVAATTPICDTCMGLPTRSFTNGGGQWWYCAEHHPDWESAT